MRVAVFSAKPYDRDFLEEANRSHNHDLEFLEARLTPTTAGLADGFGAVCAFVNDDLGAPTLERLREGGVGLVTLRSAGYNHVDVAAAARLGLTVTRVPTYSPHAVAEHAAALVLSLNRKIHRAYTRTREGNFALHGLLGFDLAARTVGVVGTGAIGRVFAHIMRGFSCRVVATDPVPDPGCEAEGVEYLPLDELLRASDIVSLHCPLTPETHHLIDADAVAGMRPGVTLVNTSRGGLVDTPAVIEGLKSGRVGALGLDVYEEEAGLFFEDLSDAVVDDDVLMRLMTFPNVLVTAHQGFFTREALTAIAATTLQAVSDVAAGRAPQHPVTAG